MSTLLHDLFQNRPCTHESYRKTNQYGLTSDTVEKFNVVLPVGVPEMACWQAKTFPLLKLTVIP